MAEEKLVISMPCSPTARTVRVGAQQPRTVQLVEPTNKLFLFGKVPVNDGKVDLVQHQSELQSPANSPNRTVMTQFGTRKAEHPRTSQQPPSQPEQFENRSKQR